jgi:hypothetical protein
MMRTDGELKLFESAAFLGQGVELDTIRLRLHALLDEKLDSCSRVMQLSRQLLNLG